MRNLGQSPTRLQPASTTTLLEHDGRNAVFEAITESPGICISKVAAEIDMPLSTSRHHVRVLERECLVEETKIRGKRRLYVADTRDIELAAALNDKATAAVLDSLSRLGPSSVTEIADDLDRHPSTVTHHLQRLAADDLVVRERRGRVVINELDGAAFDALAPTARVDPDESNHITTSSTGHRLVQ